MLPPFPQDARHRRGGRDPHSPCQNVDARRANLRTKRRRSGAAPRLLRGPDMRALALRLGPDLLLAAFFALTLAAVGLVHPFPLSFLHASTVLPLAILTILLLGAAMAHARLLVRGG